jgi:hypothetical protein
MAIRTCGKFLFGECSINHKPCGWSLKTEKDCETYSARNFAIEHNLSKGIERTPEEIERIKNIADRLGMNLKL